MSNFTEVVLEASKSKSHAEHRLKAQAPFRILIFGDFSRKPLSVVGLKPNIKIDIDNFEDVLAAMNPQLDLALEIHLPNVSINIRELEDFHPDALFTKVPLFNEFASLRQKLNSPATFQQASNDLQNMLNFSVDGAVKNKAQQADAVESNADALQRLLGQPAMVNAEDHVMRYIATMINEHIVTDVGSQLTICLQVIDEAVGALMRKILHHPDFQALEATWRSIYLLVSELEIDESLSLHLLDIDKAQLFDDMVGSGKQLSNTDCYAQLIENGVNVYGEQPWSLLIGDFIFDGSDVDLALLAALGALASHAGGVFIAGADPLLLGADNLTGQVDYQDWKVNSDDQQCRWQALRESVVAPWIGLTLPRVLLRLPYGIDTDPIDSFHFDELADITEHEAFLWGNGAFYCAVLLGQSFTAQGWQMQPGDYLDVVDLPAYICPSAEGGKLQPCAEVCLHDNVIEKIIAQGIMPFISHRQRNQVRLARMQSIGSPLQALKGAW